MILVRRIALCAATIWLAQAAIVSSAAPQITYRLLTDQAKPAPNYQSTITISADHPAHFLIGFDTYMPITQMSDNVQRVPVKGCPKDIAQCNTTANQGHIGEFYLIAPKPGAAQPGKPFTFTISGDQSYLFNQSGAPRGYIIATTKSENINNISVTDVQTVADNQVQNDLNVMYNHYAYDANNHLPNLGTAASNVALPIIPTPVSVTENPQAKPLQLSRSIALHGAQADQLASLLQAQNVTVNDTAAVSVNIHYTNHLDLPNKNLKVFQQKQGYIMTIDGSHNSIDITVSNRQGLFYALQTLLQLMPLPGQASHTLPSATIIDYPRYAYRGLMIDTARHFRSLSDLRHLIDWMSEFKLNRLQLHLTDDEGWRLGTAAAQMGQLGQLTAPYAAIGPSSLHTGAYRGFNANVLSNVNATESEAFLNNLTSPMYGTGASSYGGYYSPYQLMALQRYARAHYVNIIPEVDLPGHARAFVKAYPDALEDPSDHSYYQTPQWYHDDVINVCQASTYVKVNAVINEVHQIFGSGILNIGSDEVPEGAWVGSPKCQALLKRLGANNLSAHDQKQFLHYYFINKVAQLTKAYGLTLATWDDIPYTNPAGHTSGLPDTLPTNLRIYAWTNEQAGVKAAQNGYDVVMSPGQSLYFDLAYSDQPWEKGYNWAGYTNDFTAFTFNPEQGVPVSAQPHILGVQGELWGENLNNTKHMEYMAFPKVLGLAELAWSPDYQSHLTPAWQTYSETLGDQTLPYLAAQNVNFRIAPPTASIANGKLSVQFYPASTYFSVEYRLNATAQWQPFDASNPPSVSAQQCSAVQVRGVFNFNSMTRYSHVNEINRTLCHIDNN